MSQEFMKDENRTQRGLAIRWGAVQPHNGSRPRMPAMTGTKKASCDLGKARHKSHCIIGFHVCRMSRVGKSIERESRSVVAGSVGVGGQREVCLIGMMQMFWNVRIVPCCQCTEHC